MVKGREGSNVWLRTDDVVMLIEANSYRYHRKTRLHPPGRDDKADFVCVS